MHIPVRLSLYAVAALLLAPLPAAAFSYATGDCAAADCAEGEQFLYTNANELNAALDALEAIDALVGTATGTLSGEIVVGTSPGGELGGTWASPTIDDGISVNFADGSIAAADLASDATIDADATVHCITKQLYAPDGSEETLDLLGLPFAVTLTRYRCNTLPTTTDLQHRPHPPGMHRWSRELREQRRRRHHLRRGRDGVGYYDHKSDDRSRQPSRGNDRHPNRFNGRGQRHD